MEKRILIFTNHFDPEYFKVNDIVNWIKEKGETVTVVTGNPNYPKGKIFPGFSPFGSKEVLDNLIVYRLPLIPRGKGGKIRLVFNYLSYCFSSLLFTLFFLIPKKRFQKVFVHHTSPPFILLPALVYKKLKKAKIVLWDLDMWPQTLEATRVLSSPQIIKFLETVFTKLYQGFDLILLGSKHFEGIASKRVNPSRIKYFPNWADAVFETAAIKPKKLIQQQKLIISYTGNIGESQGLESLVQAVSIIEHKFFEIRLIGDGRNKEALKKLVKNKQLTNIIKFYDSVSPIQLIKFFNESHFLYLSLKKSALFEKTVPAKFQTYLAVGTPLIGMISGETNSLIKDNQLGYACEAHQTQQLAGLIKSLAKLKDVDYQRMSYNCRELYNNDFHSSKREQDLEILLS